MKTQIIKLQDKFILVSDEEIREGDFIVSKDSIAPLYIDGKINTVEMLLNNHWLKIISENPDFSLLSEADCKKIGFIDVKKLALEHGFVWENTESSARRVFEKWQQSLNDKKYSLEEMKIAFINGGSFTMQNYFGKIITLENSFNEFIQSLQQNVWNVELNESNQITKIL